MKTSIEVVNYLKEQNLYELLDITFKSYYNTTLLCVISNLSVTGSLSQLIHGFFKWSHTPQGYDFWYAVNQEYKNWLDC